MTTNLQNKDILYNYMYDYTTHRLQWLCFEAINYKCETMSLLGKPLNNGHSSTHGSKPASKRRLSKATKTEQDGKKHGYGNCDWHEPALVWTVRVNCSGARCPAKLPLLGPYWLAPLGILFWSLRVHRRNLGRRQKRKICGEKRVEH